MILSRQKPFEEIIGYLEGEKKVFILGCNGCAQSSGSGGPEQVAEMKTKLEEAGKEVTGIKVIDFLCEKALVKSGLRGKVEEVMVADSMLVMTCGIGVQAVAASVNKHCHPACDTINLGGSRGEWKGRERCWECGDCVLDYTAGICPLTACTKSLLNGACGGASKGNCEISPDRPCGWELIYEQAKARNQTARLRDFIAAKDFNKMMIEPELMSKQVFALEQKG